MTTQILRSEIDALQEQLALVERRAEQIKQILLSLNTELDEAIRKEQAETMLSEQAEQSAQDALSKAKDAHGLALTALTIARQANEAAQACALKKEEPIQEKPIQEKPIVKESIQEKPIVEEPIIEEPIVEKPIVEEPIETEFEQISEQKETDTTSATGTFLPPVAHIRDAISLGDKFLFHRELFGGDGEKMQRTIDTLDSMDSLEDAMQYIQKHCKWDKESQAYQLFIGILSRRFS